MACNDKLSADILKDCNNAPVAGLEVDILLVNREDVDQAALTYDGVNDLICTNFQLVSGSVGYLLEGIKQSNGASSELVVKDFTNGYRHLMSGVMLAPSAANMRALEQIMDGGSYVAIIERKWKGIANADAFLILGLDSGLVASSSTWNSKENSGIELFELASEEEYEEPRKPRVLLETDYATTKTAFDAKFVQV